MDAKVIAVVKRHAAWRIKLP